MNSNVLVITVAVTVIARAGIIAYTKRRPYRHTQRMAALDKGQNPALYLSGRLLQYIPWQSWTSAAILVLLIVAYFVSLRLGAASARGSFVELIEYLAGAVIGSLFGNAGPSQSPGGGAWTPKTPAGTGP